ncbi:MAG: Cache 3/Cache 2 fusion domain-containing protein [Bacteroidetes bacterium]|nr:Cache 3/Cache 2 fusion domain-containing protein [Nanoarchaeota archaeon]MBU1116843.1 Cache 3/Cache 2 fusion domain-containing protein [Bacteroidota bacterium]MBU1798048.1 Cache 3/Cache 2 fusion domain-containing protein [Bacteroidota bacterium]
MKKKLSAKFLIVTTPIIFVSFLVITLIVSHYEEASIYEQLSKNIKDRNEFILEEIELSDELVMQQVQSGMKLLKSITLAKGTPSIGTKTQVVGKETNDILFGESNIANNFDLVDNLKSIVGGTATIFSRYNDEFIRISTNVQQDDGSRAIGTILNPNGKSIKNILDGKAYYGLVEILNKPYLTGYEPIKNDNNEIIGIWYVGYQLSSLNRLQKIISNSKILENGFIAIMDNKNKVLFNSNNITTDEIYRILENEKSGENEDWKINIKNYEKWDYNILTVYKEDDVSSRVNDARFNVIIGGFLVSALFLGIISIFLMKLIIKPIKNLTSIADKLSTGDINIEINSRTNDEIGQLEKSFGSIVNSIKGQSHIAEMISNGELNQEANEKSENDILSKSMNQVINTLRKLIQEVNSLTNSATEGRLSERGNCNDYRGSYREIVNGFNDTLNAVVEPLKESTDVLNYLATGDFTTKVNGDYKGDHQLMKNSINTVVDSLNKTMLDLSVAVEATAKASTQIASRAEEMATGAQEQSAQTSEVAAAMEEMSRTIVETASNATTASEASIKSSQQAKDGNEKLSAAKSGMERIVDASKITGDKISSLTNKTDQIGEIAQVIDDIADQTNLLALNAAIEAARAGEQGRGFAVVADEVRKLAERTTKATKEIAETIKAIQLEAKEANTSMEEAGKAIKVGLSLNDQVGVVLNAILLSAENVSMQINQVAAASEEQSATAEQVSTNIEAINNVANESAAGVQQIASAAEDLNTLTDNLTQLVARFRIDNENKYTRGLANAHNVKLIGNK